jgi:hypothetical protein
MNIEILKDLAPTLVGDFTCEDTSDIIFNEYNNKVNKYKKNIEIGSKYFFGHLHDSNILSCKINKGNLYLKLNEIATYNFAYELIKKMELKINIRKMIFPLEIISENTNELSLNIIDKKGKIFKNKFIKLDEYISEEIIEWTDKNIKIAFNLWSKRIKYKFDDYINCKNYLLYLSCNQLKINEMQNIYWKKYFGNKYDKYYNIFLEERNKGKAISDSKLDEIFLE